MKPDLPNPQKLSDESQSAEAAFAAALRQISATTDQPRAEKVTSPHGMAAETLAKLTSTDATALAACLEKDARAINDGSLNSVEAKLASQATTTNALFCRLTQIAFDKPLTMENFSSYLKLALRAQAQSATALIALAEIKQGPRVIVAKQLNAALQQIVNNGAAPDETRLPLRRKNGRPQPASLPEPSPLTTYAPMVSRSPREATPEHSPLESVGEIHRSAQRDRETEEQP